MTSCHVISSGQPTSCPKHMTHTHTYMNTRKRTTPSCPILQTRTPSESRCLALSNASRNKSIGLAVAELFHFEILAEEVNAVVQTLLAKNTLISLSWTVPLKNMGVGANGSWLEGLPAWWGREGGVQGNWNTSNVHILPQISANNPKLSYIKMVLDSQDNLLWE